MPSKLLRLYGRNLLMHLGAAVAAFTPYLVQLATNRLGWTVATAASSGVLATWLAAHAHVSGKLAAGISNEVGAIAGKMTQPGGGQAILAELGPLLDGLFGGHAGGAATAPMAPPPGLSGIVPPGYYEPDPGQAGQPHTPNAGTV